LLSVKVGSHLFQVPDVSASDDSLQQFGLLVQQAYRSVAGRGVRRLVPLAEEDQLGPSPHWGEDFFSQTSGEEMPDALS